MSMSYMLKKMSYLIKNIIYTYNRIIIIIIIFITNEY